MGTPLVSIIIPTYNRAAMLPEAIDSCLRQTYSNIEVVIVDDGSGDETPEVAGRFARRDRRVRYIRQDNQKLPAALNTGHRASRGDYLTWSSDDNRYEPDAIGIMVGYLETHPEYGLAYCDYKLLDEDGITRGIRRLPGSGDPLNNDVIGACFLYRREVYAAVGEYDRASFLAEDFDYWVRIQARFRIVHLSDVAPYAYRRHGESLTNTHSPEVILQGARVRARHDPVKTRRRRIMSDGHFGASYWFCQQGRTLRSIRGALTAIALNPIDLKKYKWLLFGIARNRLIAAARSSRGKKGARLIAAEATTAGRPEEPRD